MRENDRVARLLFWVLLFSGLALGAVVSWGRCPCECRETPKCNSALTVTYTIVGYEACTPAPCDPGEPLYTYSHSVTVTREGPAAPACLQSWSGWYNANEHVTITAHSGGGTATVWRVMIYGYQVTMFADSATAEPCPDDVAEWDNTSGCVPYPFPVPMYCERITSVTVE